MSDSTTITVPSSFSFDFPLALLPKGPKGDPGGVQLLCDAFKPRLTLNGQDVALGYLSQLGITREFRGDGGGELSLWGNLQFHGIIPCPDAEVVKPTPLIFWLPKPIAQACGTVTVGMVGFKSNLWPADGNHPNIPAFGLRGGGGNAWCYVDGLPLNGSTNPTQLGLRDLNPQTQLEFWVRYPTD